MPIKSHQNVSYHYAVTLSWTEAVVDLARQLPFEVDFWQVQNVYYRLLRSLLPGRRREAEGGSAEARQWTERCLGLGEKLSVKTTGDPVEPLAAR